MRRERTPGRIIETIKNLDYERALAFCALKTGELILIGLMAAAIVIGGSALSTVLFGNPDHPTPTPTPTPDETTTSNSLILGMGGGREISGIEGTGMTKILAAQATRRIVK